MKLVEFIVEMQKLEAAYGQCEVVSPTDEYAGPWPNQRSMIRVETMERLRDGTGWWKPIVMRGQIDTETVIQIKAE